MTTARCGKEKAGLQAVQAVLFSYRPQLAVRLNVESAMRKHMQPVSVWESDSVQRTLTDVEGAARFLLEKWPVVEDTAIYRAARQAALDALTGAIFVPSFRAAFVAAAEEAGILA